MVNNIEVEAQNSVTSIEEADAKIEDLQEEQDNLDFDKKSNEELLEEQKKIVQRIKRLEEEKEDVAKNIELFLEEVILIVESGITPKEQKDKIEEANLYKLIPESISKIIEENFQKFNFIDYKVAEVLLEEDLIGKEINKLKEKQNLIDENIEDKTNGSSMEKEHVPDIGKIEESLGEEFGSGDELGEVLGVQ